MKERAFDAACQALGLSGDTIEEFIASIETLQRRADCLKAIEDKFLTVRTPSSEKQGTSAPSTLRTKSYDNAAALAWFADWGHTLDTSARKAFLESVSKGVPSKVVSPKAIAWRHKPSGTVQTFPLEARQLEVAYQFEALGVIKEDAPAQEAPTTSEYSECFVSNEAEPAQYTVQFGLALNRLAEDFLASRKIPGAASTPADSTQRSWNDAVMKVYLNARQSRNTEGIPSHWLELMKESLLSPGDSSLKESSASTVPSALSPLTAALVADLAEMRNVTQRYFSSPAASKTVRDASGVILELETRTTELLMKLR